MFYGTLNALGITRHIWLNILNIFLGFCYLIIYKIFPIYAWSLPEEQQEKTTTTKKRTHISSVCVENRISWNMETQQEQQAAGMILSVVLRIIQTMREHENPIRNAFCCWHKNLSTGATLALALFWAICIYMRIFPNVGMAWDCHVSLIHPLRSGTRNLMVKWCLSRWLQPFKSSLAYGIDAFALSWRVAHVISVTAETTRFTLLYTRMYYERHWWYIYLFRCLKMWQVALVCL